MKKKMMVVLLAAVTAAAVLGGCGKTDGQTQNSSVAEAENDVQISAKELLNATDYKVEKCVKLNDYMNMTVELDQSYEVTDDDVKSYIEQLISYYPDYEVTDKQTVEEGDIVNIDYVGKKDGEAFSGGSDEGHHLEIGSGSFIDGFEDGLIGKSVGETVDLNLTFPEDYQSEDLAGQDVVFTVTINSIDTEKEMTYDALTDDYVNSNFGTSGISTVEGMKNQIRSDFETQNEQYRMQEIQEKVLDKLAEECTVEIPEGLLDQKITDYKARIQSKADAAGQTLDEFVQANMGVTEEEYNEQVNTYMEESLIKELILEAIVQDQDLSISQSDFDSFVTRYISAYGIESADAFYEEYGGEAYVKLSYAENQALSKVMDSVKTTVKADDGTEE